MCMIATVMVITIIHIASLAVMVHMTFGCNWHHGFGSAHACENQNSLSYCCASNENDSASELVDVHDCDGHGDHDHDSDLPLRSTFDADDSEHNHSHLCCQDDGCHVIKAVKYVFTPLDFSISYLGGVEKAAIAKASVFTVDRFPDCRFAALKIRSHLLFAVQLI